MDSARYSSMLGRSKSRSAMATPREGVGVGEGDKARSQFQTPTSHAIEPITRTAAATNGRIWTTSPGNRISAEPPPVAEKLGLVGRRRGLLYNWQGNERLRSEGKHLGRFWPLDFILWPRIFYRTAKSLARRATCAMGVFGLFETRPV